MADVLGQSTRTTRFLATLLSGFGALALGLSAVGVFGVASYTSGRRRPEFGVRLALGSSRSEVVRGAIVRSLGPVMVGLVAGLAVAAATSRLLTSALFGVRPLDPATFVGVTALLGTVGVVASAIPAWRASRVDPVSVLSSD
jgi:ABC-type antimicrobial peptide transport system permease subunit